MKWLEIKVNAKAEAIDAITEILYEFGASGVAIDEPIDYEAMKIDNLFWDYIEPEEGEQDKESSVSAYFSEADPGHQRQGPAIAGIWTGYWQRKN